MSEHRMMPATNDLDFQARSIGRAAFATLASESQAAVTGSTSRGIFLLTPASRVLFVSFESYRGPLTITLVGAEEFPRSIEHASPARLTHDGITLADGDVTITVDADSVWQPGPFPGALRSYNDQLQTAAHVARELVLTKGAVGFSGLLPPLLSEPPSSSTTPDVLPLVLRLRESLRNREWAQAAESAGNLLGVGRGLTPSGDDLIYGLLLALNRSRRTGLAQFNSRVIEQAYKKTTALSANLIESAANGEADERLIVAVDGILAGLPEPVECVRALSDWGASSGVDALAGMVVAFSLSPEWRASG